ncbi:hypothetical protein [Methylomonas sp. MgM2]
MKKPTPIASWLAALVIALISTNVLAGADNCTAFYPKVPYNCVLLKVKDLPSERADFSAFETGATKASGHHMQYKLRSVSRNTARKLRAQTTEIVN